MIFVSSTRDKIPSSAISVNTTSRSCDFGRQLSPFFLGPVKMGDGSVCKNVENAWQFSKVYKQHDTDGSPSRRWREWARIGWNDTWAHRYPMGKGAIPLYSWWNGEKLSYVDARKKIYIPIYWQAAQNTGAYQRLCDLANGSTDIYLIDFDGYNHQSYNMSIDDVINNTKRKMGHAFVLYMMLTDYKMEKR